MSPSTHLSVKTLLAAACAFAGVSTTTLIAAPALTNAPTTGVGDTNAVLDRAAGRPVLAASAGADAGSFALVCAAAAGLNYVVDPYGLFGTHEIERL